MYSYKMTEQTTKIESKFLSKKTLKDNQKVFKSLVKNNVEAVSYW